MWLDHDLLSFDVMMVYEVDRAFFRWQFLCKVLAVIGIVVSGKRAQVHATSAIHVICVSSELL
jgi:hypothetical protein